MTVVFIGGESLTGDIFLNPNSRFGSAPQGPAEFLNEADEYFALGDAAGDVALVAKASVASIATPAAPDAAAAGGPAPHPVTACLTLASGATVTGAMRVDAPPSRARLLDFLNANHDRFLPVELAGQVVLVNRQAIVHVHELN